MIFFAYSLHGNMPVWRRNEFSKKKHLQVEIQAYCIMSALWSDCEPQDFMEFEKPGTHDLVTRQKAYSMLISYSFCWNKWYHDNCQNAPCDYAYSNSFNGKEYLPDISTTVLIRLYILRQILCWELSHTYSKGFHCFVFMSFTYNTVRASHSWKVVLVKVLIRLPSKSLNNNKETVIHEL